MAIASILVDPNADNNASTALENASIADSKAVSVATEASIADSKAVSVATEASIADSKAVVAGATADGASTAVGSAIGSEPGVGDYKVTDLKRDADGSIVFEYDDSQIT